MRLPGFGFVSLFCVFLPDVPRGWQAQTCFGPDSGLGAGRLTHNPDHGLFAWKLLGKCCEMKAPDVGFLFRYAHPEHRPTWTGWIGL